MKDLKPWLDRRQSLEVKRAENVVKYTALFVAGAILGTILFYGALHNVL